MSIQQSDWIHYSILDPTGNITALVESPVDICSQLPAAADIMKQDGKIEQVGFVKFDMPGADDVQAELRMAGGEFCGNAAMSTAALFLIRNYSGPLAGEKTVRLRVSGSSYPVEVKLEQDTANSYRAGVLMPPAREIDWSELEWGKLKGSLPVVRMEGITHVIIEPDSVFFRLKENKADAENAVREWCSVLSADCLGLMFLEETACMYKMTPLVYAPGNDTVFWENSCASGSSAVGMYLASIKKTAGSLMLQEPGGALRVENDMLNGETRLYGKVRWIRDCELQYPRI